MDTPKLSPLKGLLVLLAVIVVIGVYIALITVLHLGGELWAGFLFLLYWSMGEKAQLDRVPAAFVGALVGMGTASMMALLPPLMGVGPGMAIFGITVLVLVYAIIMGWVPVAVNMATMLFLTVGTVPHLEAAHANYGAIFLNIVAGMVFFCGLAFIANSITRRKAGKAVQAE